MYVTHRLQSVLNAAARLTYHLRRSDHITKMLVCLHCLSSPQRAQFKIALLAYNVLHGHAPQYLGSIVSLTSLASDLFVLTHN